MITKMELLSVDILEEDIIPWQYFLGFASKEPKNGSQNYNCLVENEFLWSNSSGG